MKKLLLINPVGKKSGYLMSRFSTFAPLGLAYVAAVTPAKWEVKIIDENYEEFVYEEADLVGITAFTSNITRAYELSSLYRKNKVAVVMGGIHVSMHPDEALRFSDAIVIGEVEGIWKTVLQDFEGNKLKKKYVGPRIDFTSFGITPRRDLLNTGYLWNSIQTSRGCPFDCYFCTVSKYLGRKYRQRSAENVLSEIEQISGEYIAFVDDNLIGYSAENRERAKTLFQGMIDRKVNKKWWMQSSINVIDDESVISRAAQAGCMFVFIGFETINAQTLIEMKKGVNLKLGVENYKSVVDVFHRHGIGVMGAFIIGNDHESFRYYELLTDFIVKAGIDIVQVSILTPLPGTQLMEQLRNQNRIIYDNFPQDWDKYRFSYMVHQPIGTHAEQIYAGDNYIKNRIYSFPVYPYRLVSSFFALKNMHSFTAAVKLNQALKKSWKNSHYYKKYRKNSAQINKLRTPN